MSDSYSTPVPAPGKTEKPPKPYPELPLTAHPNGTWKIRGKIHYFGTWADPEGALSKYLEHKDALHAGKVQRPDPDNLTVKDVANAFIDAKRQALRSFP